MSGTFILCDLSIAIRISFDVKICKDCLGYLEGEMVLWRSV